MYPYLIFIGEFIILAFFSKLLINSLAKLFFRIFKTFKNAVIALAVLFFPGTLIHELSHVVVAGAMLVPVGEIEFLPEIREDSIKLGSAQIAKTDPLRRMIIGFAPILMGFFLMLAPLYFFSSLDNLPTWFVLAYIFLIFEISNTMFSSRKDLEGTIEVLGIIGAIFLTLYLFGLNQVFNFLEAFLMTPKILEVIKKIDLFLLFPIVLDIFIFQVIKIFLPKHHHR